MHCDQNEINAAMQEYEAYEKKIYDWWRQNRYRGFFRVPGEEGIWSASILLRQVMERNAARGRTEALWRGVESGGMSYLVGEVMFALDRSILGEYYPYRVHGVHDHEHSFLSVLQTAVQNGSMFTPEQTARYYAPWMLTQMEAIRTDRTLRKAAKCWAETTYSTDEEMIDALISCCPSLAPCVYRVQTDADERLCRDIDQVYELAAEYPEHITVQPEQYSEEQLACIEAIRQYQLNALAGKVP